MSPPAEPVRAVPPAAGRSRRRPVFRSAGSTAPGAAAVAEVAARLGDDAGLVLAFVADGAPGPVADALTAWMGDRVVGCTSAGGIGPGGYRRSGVVAVALGGPGVTARTVRLAGAEGDDVPPVALEGVRRAATAAAGTPAFAVLLVDGLSLPEDDLAEHVRAALGGLPLIGGSAADALRFEAAGVLAGGTFRPGTATVTVITVPGPVRPFRVQHHTAAGPALVVTGADPGGRTVRCLNGRPAVAEYARVTGTDPAAVDVAALAVRPLLVQAGGGAWVRGVRAVEPDGALRLLATVERGTVLRVARPVSAADVTGAVGAVLDGLRSELGGLAGVLAFESVLRRLEVEALGADAAMDGLLSGAGAAGFSTFGEQYDAVHVNHTLVGLAFGG